MLLPKCQIIHSKSCIDLQYQLDNFKLSNGSYILPFKDIKKNKDVYVGTWILRLHKLFGVVLGFVDLHEP